jgi:hypothetical protein
MHKMRSMTLSYSNLIILLSYSRKQNVGLPAVLSSSVALGFKTVNNLCISELVS